MNITEQLLQEVSALISGNATYDTYQKRWKYLLESYMGGDEYRKAQYLTKYQLETNSEYLARLNNTPLENHCQSIVSVYKSFLFRTQPVREFNSIEAMPELQDFLKDADMDGRSLDAFMKDVATWSSVFGHCFILVTKPNVGAITRAEEQQLGARPYVNLLTPLVVLDWRFTRSPNGRYDLSYFRYLEDVNASIRTVKEWTKESIKTSTVDVDNSVITAETTEPNGLGEIPVVIAYNQRSPLRGLGISDLADIADLQRFIYNNTSEVAESMRLDTHPSLVATNETRVGTGAGSLILMPDNMDPGLKPYVLENSGASIDAIYKSIQHTTSVIDKIANTGAVRTTESRNMSGVAMTVEMELLSAKLSEKADNLELAEEQMWKLWCKYMGVEYTVEIDYPGSFNVRDSQSEIAQLKTAADTNPQDPRVKQAIDAKILDWLDMDVEDTLPESSTAEDIIQEKIMSGDSDAKIIAEGTTPDALLAAKQDLLDVEDQS
jgi:hypothetical protein